MIFFSIKKIYLENIVIKMDNLDSIVIPQNLDIQIMDSSLGISNTNIQLESIKDEPVEQKEIINKPIEEKIQLVFEPETPLIKKDIYHNSIFIFDMDGTLCESGKMLTPLMIQYLTNLKNKYNCDLGINGGGTYEKLLIQLGDAKSLFKYIFAECGSVVYENDRLIHKNNLLRHKSYSNIQKLIRYSLKFISETNYEINGHFVDVRNGLVYISMVGLQANDDQRELFLKMDKKMEFRKRLLLQLNERKVKLMANLPSNQDITICYGGKVGISIYPTEWDKVQVLKYIKKYENIHYFGDRYEEEGNDYKLINHENVIGYKVNNPDETIEKIRSVL